MYIEPDRHVGQLQSVPTDSRRQFSAVCLYSSMILKFNKKLSEGVLYVLYATSLDRSVITKRPPLAFTLIQLAPSSTLQTQGTNMRRHCDASPWSITVTTRTGQAFH